MVKRAGGALLLSVRIDHASRAPGQHAALRRILRELILSGGFAAGERLPASRTLARDLGVSRTTVIEAFDRLTAEGLIESRVGAGTFVSKALAVPTPAAAGRPRGQPRSAAGRRLVARDGARGRALRRAPAAAARCRAHSPPRCRPSTPFRWRSGRACRPSTGGSQRDDGDGLRRAAAAIAQLRQAIAAHLRANRGIACDAEQIFIVGGAQQAFSLIGSDAAQSRRPGLVRESRRDRRAQQPDRRRRASWCRCPVDDQGMRVDAGLRLQPALPPGLRHAVAPAAAGRGDEPRAALRAAARGRRRRGRGSSRTTTTASSRSAARPLPTLKSVDATGLVIYVGHVQQVAVPVAAPGLPARAAGAGRYAALAS